MSKKSNTIEIYLRLKPTKVPYPNYSFFYSKLNFFFSSFPFFLEVDELNEEISFTIPKQLSQGYINNQKEVYKYHFNRVFEMPTS